MLSLPFVMALACRVQRLLPSEALNACTVNAAHALGVLDRVGSLEVGKQADVVVLQTDDYRSLVVEIGNSLVEQVYLKGKPQWSASFSMGSISRLSKCSRWRMVHRWLN
ncbi:MAG UNVERIFIED_CONTAM: amidohydrolase family protein [Anaerolineae bacterium]